jgi:hypothetical protein
MAMPTLVRILTIYPWILVAGLIYLLVHIARFYEIKYAELYRNADGQRTHYRLFWLPFGLFLVAAGRYALLDDFTGDIAGDLGFCVGGILLGILVYRLERQMTGGHR